MIIPEKNQKDLVEIPKHIKRKIKFIPVKDMQAVISHAMDAKFDKPKVQRVKKKKS